MSIEVCNLSFSYGERPVLNGVSFTASKGRLLSILGPNGVGKSTLFRCILGLEKKYTGDVFIGEEHERVKELEAGDLARRIAYIPQYHYPTFNYSVIEMVLMGTTARSKAFSPPGAKEERAALDALDRLGIADYAGRSYTHISGGERQLVLVARALAQKSSVLVMDEPTANLDYGNQIRVLSHIRSLADEGYTVIQSTHNPEQSYLFAHEILAMKDGCVLAQGPPKNVIDSELINSLYGIEAEIESIKNDAYRVCIPKSCIGNQ